jgi:HAE1 family hydrophobic/amphiphilic exporter-1
MAAVFVPVGFMQGPAGVFFKQFAFTLATAIFNFCFERFDLKSPHCVHCF